MVYCLLMCSHLRCHDLSVVPWTATLMVLWPFLRLMASMAAVRRDCFSRSMVSKRLVWTAESGTMFQTMTPAFYINIPPLYGNPYGVPGLRCLQAPGGRWSVPASGWCGWCSATEDPDGNDWYRQRLLFPCNSYAAYGAYAHIRKKSWRQLPRGWRVRTSRSQGEINPKPVISNRFRIKSRSSYASWQDLIL